MTTLPAIRSEEGLAAINTIMNSRVRYLWLPALQYCKFFLGLSNIFLLLYFELCSAESRIGIYLLESRISVISVAQDLVRHLLESWQQINIFGIMYIK